MGFRGSWTRADLLEQVGRSQTGEELIREAAQAGYIIEVVEPESDQLGEGISGSHNGETRTIRVDGSESLDQATGSLAHELGHSHQRLNGAYKAPEQSSKEEFINQKIENEKNSESTANQVAYELHQQGISGPRQEQEQGLYGAQARAYGQTRDEGFSHDLSTQASEPQWSASGVEPYYEKQAIAQWNDANVVEAEMPQAKGEERQALSHEGNTVMPPDPPVSEDRETSLGQTQAKGTSEPSFHEPSSILSAERSAMLDDGQALMPPPPPPAPDPGVSQSEGMSI